MLSSREEQIERRRVFAQDQSLRASTFHQHAISDAETPRGRYSAISNAQVVGATAVPNYPAASAHQADPCGTEPPLGYRVNDLEPLGPSVLAEAQGNSDGAVAPSVPLDVERTASPLSQSGDPAPGSSSHFPPGPARKQRDAGSPRTYRRY